MSANIRSWPSQTEGEVAAMCSSVCSGLLKTLNTCTERAYVSVTRSRIWHLPCPPPRKEHIMKVLAATLCQRLPNTRMKTLWKLVIPLVKINIRSPEHVWCVHLNTFVVFTWTCLFCSPEHVWCVHVNAFDAFAPLGRTKKRKNLCVFAISPVNYFVVFTWTRLLCSPEHVWCVHVNTRVMFTWTCL